MTVVDVNTGKFTGSGGNLEETVTKNNIEAAEEIVRQLRLRDVGGIIVIDFIDMVLESNRDLVLRRLLECLGRDRTKHQVAEVTSLGLVQMTRKRVGQGLLEVVLDAVRVLQRPRPARAAGTRSRPRSRRPTAFARARASAARASAARARTKPRTRPRTRPRRRRRRTPRPPRRPPRRPAGRPAKTSPGTVDVADPTAETAPAPAEVVAQPENPADAEPASV